MTMTNDDFKFICKLVKERSGISLSDGKGYLVESRLLPIVRKNDMSTISDIVSKIRTTNNSELIIDIVEAMTTNETSFFRDVKPFDILKKTIIPRIIENNTLKNINIWSAACSTGQEAYSVAITLEEDKLRLGSYKKRIIATDIDTVILKKAEEAVYSQFEVQRGLPIMLLMKYFIQQESYGEKWELKENIKKYVKFKYLNLLDQFPSNKYDIIYCRNVLIYFDAETKSKILDRLSACLKDHGVLFLGSSETITGLTDKLKQLDSISGLFCLNK